MCRRLVRLDFTPGGFARLRRSWQFFPVSRFMSFVIVRWSGRFRRFRSVSGFGCVVFVILIIEHFVLYLLLGSRVMTFVRLRRSDRMESFGFGGGIVMDVERCTIAFHLLPRHSLRRAAIVPPHLLHATQPILHALSVQRRNTTFLRQSFPPPDSPPAVDDLEHPVPNPRTARDIVLL